MNVSKYLSAAVVLAGVTNAITIRAAAQEALCDETAAEIVACDEQLSCDDLLPKELRPKHFDSDFRYRTPAMLGDFFGGSAPNFQGNSRLDRLMVIADELDAPNALPAGNSVLSISEPGPVGVFSTSIASATELQSIFRNASPFPSINLVGTINSDATLTTQQTVAQIQAQLAGSALPYDIVLLQQPPGAYTADVHSIFQARNGNLGSTVYDAAASGAMLQGGVDSLSGGEDFDAFYFYDYVIRFNMAMADATSGGVGRIKLAEGGAVLPTDRVFFRYSNFQNAGANNSGTDLNRFVPGFEKTFFDGLTSMEVRAPFATDASTSYVYNAGTFGNGYDTRFGNLALYAKGLLLQTETTVLTGGLGLTLPTASDINLKYADGTSLLQVSNQSLHVQPFLGLLYTPSRDFFAQGFLQYDATASGNSVAINSTGTGLQKVGTLTDSNQIFVDAGLGCWLYRSENASGLTGIIPTVEVHQTSSTQNGDVVAAGPFQVGNFSGSTSITSIVAGTTLEFGQQTQLTAGYATPIGGGRDSQYDGALQIFLNRRLGL